MTAPGWSASWYALTWQHNPQLGVSLAQIDAVPPGTYRLTIYTPQGTREFPVTITEYGGWLRLPDLSK